jgi:succinate dehydrogenase / fumarate reductase flavoprotein subunit
VVKDEQGLTKALDTLASLRERFSRMSLSDSGIWTNQNLSWARAVGDMLVLADPILRGSLERRESRGSHYRVDYLERNDEKFLKTTIASYNEATGEADISFEETEYGVVTPRIRDYSTTKKQKKDAAEPAGGTDRTSGAAAETPAAVGGKA